MKLQRRMVLAGLAVGAFDQLSKWGLGRQRMDNPAALLGIVRGTRLVLVVLMAIGIAAVGRVLYRAAARGRVAPWTVGAAIGGAASNLVDRVAFGAVRDVIAVGPMIINAADIAVSIACVVAFAGIVRSPATRAFATAALATSATDSVRRRA